MKALCKWLCCVTLALLATAAIGAADISNTTNTAPPPGTLNYVEGQVAVQGHRETQKSVGSTYLQPNQDINTGNGNAEVLLTPGVYLRVGHNSSVKMISPDLANTEVQVTQGNAMVEVDELFKQNDLTVAVGNGTARIEKDGLYEFDANQPSVKVLDGEAIAYEGNQHVKLGKGHEALLEPGNLVRTKFNKDEVEEDPLYRWSKLRSEYATEANINEGNYLEDEGGWWGPGWYWDPYWWGFAWVPGFGMGWGPFGYPFFSPWYVGWAPYYGFGLGYNGHYRYPVAGGAGHMPPLARTPRAGEAGLRPLPNAGFGGRVGQAGAFRGNPGFRSFGGPQAGGFAGGFHGGGFAGGGFHGGFGGGRR